MSSPSPAYAWAKLDADGAALPLVEHAADVAAVLTQLALETPWRRRLESAAGRTLSAHDCDRLAALAFLHDLGKANRGFWERQFPGKPIVGHTNETAALFYVDRICNRPLPSQLFQLIQAWGAADLFSAAMAHHGRPLEAYAGDELRPDLGRAARNLLQTNKHPADYWLPANGYDPLEQLALLLDAARSRFPAAFSDSPALPDTAPFISLYCGLLTLADWLGSDTFLFPVAGPHGPDREALRRDAAVRAVTGRGLADLPTPFCTFAAAFDVPAPRGLQAEAVDASLGPVALLEAETGSGKTEAALWRWLALRRAGAVDGLYFALPTRSAAVQLHGRVQRLVDRVFGPGVVEAVLAVPGYLRAGDAEGQVLPNFGVL